jgi:SPP1 gp7 family putative phage head morphogenesis protein
MLNGLFKRRKIKSDFQESEKKPDLRELTYSGILNEYAQYWDDCTLNPDELIDVKGWDYLKEMAADDTIHSCLEIKKTGRLSTEWDIEAVSESPEDKKTAAFIKYNFTRMDGTFIEKIKDMLSAIEFGHSMSEKNLQQYPDGEWKNYIGLKSIKTRDPKHIGYKIDKHGNIEDVIQKKDYITGLKKDIHIPRDKCIIYTPNASFANPYGEPELKYVFKPYLAKKWVVRFWNIALERFGAGITIGTYDDGMAGQKTYLENVLKNLQAKTEIVKPRGIDIEMKNPMTGGKMAYEFALEKHETAIARALLIPDLLGFSKFTEGSFALGKKHFDVFLWVLKKLGRDIEETIVDEQIIRPLIRINFGDNTLIPHFKFAPLLEEDKASLFEQIKNLTEARILNMTPEDEVYFRKVAHLPQRSIADIKADKEEKERKAEEIRQQMQKNQEEKEKEEEEKNKDEEDNKFAEALSKSYRAYKAFKFKELGNFWDNVEDYAIVELRNICRKMKSSFMDGLERKGYLNVDNPISPSEVEKLKLKYTGEFKKTLINAMTLGYLHSKAIAINEMREADKIIADIFKKDIPIPEYGFNKFSFQDMEFEPEFNLKAEKAIAQLEKKVPVKTSELTFYTRKAYTVTGIESERILGEAKNIIYKHLQTGDKRRTKEAFRKLWDKYEETGKLTDKGTLSTAHRLETIVRTNVSEAMNEGRRTMYEDPQIADEIVAYTVSAILDSNTTPYCESIDGQTFPKDEFEFPPYHFQCRTVALPIYRGEEHTLKNWKESPYEFY